MPYYAATNCTLTIFICWLWKDFPVIKLSPLMPLARHSKKYLATLIFFVPKSRRTLIDKPYWTTVFLNSSSMKCSSLGKLYKRKINFSKIDLGQLYKKNIFFQNSIWDNFTKKHYRPLVYPYFKICNYKKEKVWIILCILIFVTIKKELLE